MSKVMRAVFVAGAALVMAGLGVAQADADVHVGVGNVTVSAPVSLNLQALCAVAVLDQASCTMTR
jgi:hypothetical protein